MWLLFRTLRLSVNTTEAGTNPYDATIGQRFLYCVWHDSMVIPVFGGKHHSTTALTSLHADGSFVARVLKFNGISSIRGSTNRITTGAIRELMRKTDAQHIVITPDGPRGPARRMSSGVAYLASRTGRAIVPTAYACSACWRIPGSWSDLIVPRPFARVVLLAGAPIHVPPDLNAEDLRSHAARIQGVMDDLHAGAEGAIQRSAARRIRHRWRRLGLTSDAAGHDGVSSDEPSY